MKLTLPISFAVAGALGLMSLGIAAHATASNLIEVRWRTGALVASSNYSSLTHVAVSMDDLPVVYGDFAGTATFPTGADDSVTVTSVSSSSDLVVGGLNAEAEYFTWLTTITGNGYKYANSLDYLGQGTQTQADDSLLLTGHMLNDTYFPTGPNDDDSIALPGQGSVSSFVGVIPPGGTHFAWVTQMTATESAVVQSAAIRPSGDVIVAGQFRGTATFPTAAGTITLDSPSANSGFIAQMAADDSVFEWVQRIQAPAPALVSSVRVGVSVDDTPHVAGAFTGTVRFATGPDADDSIVLTGDPTVNDVFVAALNSDDSYFAWAQVVSGTGSDSAATIEATSSGSTLVTGNFRDTLSFPSAPGEPAITVTSRGDNDFYVASISAGRSFFDWAVGVGGSAYDWLAGTELTEDDQLLTVGTFEGAIQFPGRDGIIDLDASSGTFDLFVAQMAADDSSFAWAQRGGATPGSYVDGYSVAPMSDGSPVVTGYLYGSVELPGSSPLVSLTSRMNGFGLFGLLEVTALPPGPGPQPPTPPSAPSAPDAQAGDAAAQVTWAQPATSGSFGITSYQVSASPGGRGCLVNSPTLTCEVNGLVNGTSYTFTVRALSGAGWSGWSLPSDVVIPTPVTPASILITGSRAQVRGKPGVIVTGATTGFGMGAILRPWVRMQGQPDFTQGSAILVDASGEFTWQRRGGKKMTIYVATPDGSTKSNRLTLPKSGA